MRRCDMSASSRNSANYVLVVAIGIGTSDSGIAYSFNLKNINGHHKIFLKHWQDRSKMLCESTPTCALFNKEKKFKAFGAEAESQYREHVKDDTYNDVYYFDRFIKDMFKNEVNGEFLLTDQAGNTLPSIDVVTACIRYMRDRAFDLSIELTTSDFRWVIPVPVSWNDQRMRFMRTAAVNAGLPNEHIMIVKESEAAFRYCSFQNDKLNESSILHPPWQERHFLLLNVNNFAVDMTVHRAPLNSHILELYKTKVENLGNTPLEQLIANMFCSDVLDSYIDTHDFEYICMKKGFGDNYEAMMPHTLCYRIPSLLLSHFESKCGIKLVDHIRACYGGGSIRDDKLKIATELLKPNLREIYEHIVRSIQRIFETFRLIDLSALLIVGNYSEYPMLHDVIKEAFPDKQIIVPKNAKLAVFGGAVLHGHQLLWREIIPCQ